MAPYPSSIPYVDLRQVSLQTEIVLRGGNMQDHKAQKDVRQHYMRQNTLYPELPVGLSCLFRPGATALELAQEEGFPNAKLSVATVQSLIQELATVGCEPVLFITPVIPRSPSHHSLVIARNGLLELRLQRDVLDALARAMTIVENPFKRKRP